MKILLISASAWFVAQFIKTVLNIFINKKLDISLMFASGGMPSAHSAFVSSVATTIGLIEGFNSTLFTLAAAFAMVVVYDAFNVRRAVGIQGIALNKMIEYIINEEKDPIEIKTLKIVMGHTPLQVFFGTLLGIIHVFLIFYLGFI